MAQVKLNPKRINNLTARQRLSYSTNIQKHRRTTDRPFLKVCKPNANITMRKTSGPNSSTGKTAVAQVDKSNNEKDGCCGVFDDNDNDDDDDDDDDGNDGDDGKKYDKSDGDDNDDDENNDCFYDKFESKSSQNQEGPSCSTTKTRKSYDSPTQSPKKSNLESDKPPSKISIRTKYFLTSILKFKRSLRVKRRHSNSCSDLFVI